MENKKNIAHRICNVMRNSKNMHPTERRKIWGISMEDFGVHWVGGVYGNFVGILWEFPQVFLWVRVGYRNWNTVPTAALQTARHRTEVEFTSAGLNLFAHLLIIVHSLYTVFHKKWHPFAFFDRSVKWW